MDSLQSILGQRDFTPPNEIEVIQNYVFRRYKSKCKVVVNQDHIALIVRGSALAGTLKLEQQRLIEECGLTKKLVIRLI